MKTLNINIFCHNIPTTIENVGGGVGGCGKKYLYKISDISKTNHHKK